MTTTNREARLEQHIVDLCAAFGVRRTIIPRAEDARGGGGRVLVPRVVCDATYAINLHELGHCLSPFGGLHAHGSSTWRMTGEPATLRDVRLRLEEEHAAWDWAHHYALGQEWTAGMASVEKHALETYYAHARQVGVRGGR